MAPSTLHARAMIEPDHDRLGWARAEGAMAVVQGHVNELEHGDDAVGDAARDVPCAGRKSVDQGSEPVGGHAKPAEEHLLGHGCGEAGGRVDAHGRLRCAGCSEDPLIRLVTAWSSSRRRAAGSTSDGSRRRALR